MSRDKLKAYQTTYAEAMAKYGLQRGVEGSEAKHISTQQYYREVFVRKNEMAEQIENLKEKLYRGIATRADITRVTRRLGDEIAHVYGFPIPRRQAPVQER